MWKTAYRIVGGKCQIGDAGAGRKIILKQIL
jgi:hypothetical protein